ncbi:hypothetical protein IJQ51_03120 [Candidatus Saccharibacteria bacterium]|nr:hypothetical protein [Candidatus Saccharibacteria bacterium]
MMVGKTHYLQTKLKKLPVYLQRKIIKSATKTTGHFGAVLDKVLTFPFAQHMLSDAPGVHTHYGSEAALRKAVESVDFSKIKTLGSK